MYKRNFRIVSKDLKAIKEKNEGESVDITHVQHPKYEDLCYTRITVLKIFKSQAKPKLLQFDLNNGTTELWIYKSGDNLYSDSLIMRLFIIFNEIWRNLDINFEYQYHKSKLKSIVRNITYCVYPNEGLMNKDGFIEYIECLGVEGLWNRNSLIRKTQYKFNEFSTMSSGGMSLVERCASSIGSFISCYLLGIGDRHQGNMLITPNGHMFNIDFGYIFGESTLIETGHLPLPWGFVDFLVAEDVWDIYIETSWKAIEALRYYEYDIYELLLSEIGCFSEKHFTMAYNFMRNIFQKTKRDFIFDMKNGKYLKLVKDVVHLYGM